VGYTAPCIGIAMVATSMGIQVKVLVPNIKKLKPDHLSATNNITVTSLSELEYMKYLVGLADSAIVLDKKDPLVYHLKRSGKKIWFPFSNETA